MPRVLLTMIATLLAVLTFFNSPATAGKFNRVLSVGDPAPDFSHIIGTDDEEHSLADYSDARLIVLLFTCNHCPVASAYEERILSIAADYAPRGVQLIAINCNNMEADRLPAMKERAKTKGYPFPYLYDASQQTGRAYGALVTPEVYVFAPGGTIAYMGAIDDSWDNASEVEHAYLRDALEALLTDSTPPTQETKAKGCGIQYEE